MNRKKYSSRQSINCKIVDFQTNISNIKPNGLDSALLEIKFDLYRQTQTLLTDVDEWLNDLIYKVQRPGSKLSLKNS